MTTLTLLGVGLGFGVDGLSHSLRQREVIATDFGAVWGGALLGGCLLSVGLSGVALGKRIFAILRKESVRAPIRVAFYAFVLGAALELMLMQPYAGRNLHMALGVAAALPALGFGWGREIEQRFPRALRVADIALMNACLLAAGAELALRGIALARPSPLFMQATSAAGRIAAFRPPAGQVRLGFPCNAQGHYDVEFRRKGPGDPPVVVCIGDSFSQGCVPHSRHFTKVAERALAGPKVYNMGVASTGPLEYRWLLENEALPLDPDLVVVDLFFGNDITECQERNLSRLWFDRENLLVFQVPLRLARLAQERRGKAVLEQGAGSALVLDADVPQVFPWVADPQLELPSFTPERFLEVERLRVEKNCGAPCEEFPAFIDAISRLREACAARRVPLIFLLIPDEFQVEDALWRAVTERDTDRWDRFKPQRDTEAWLARSGIPALDLLPILRLVPPLADGRRHLYHDRNTHFNARGNAIVGEALATFLKPLLRRS